MDIKKGQIGNALESVAPNHVVAEASAIYDQDKEKYQGQINAEVDAQIFDAEDQSTKTLIERVQDLEGLGSISLGPVEAQIATGTDFDDPTAEQRAKVPTVGAILEGFDPDGAYDVTARNAGSPKFETLDALLSDENLATLIPEAKRHGGMFIKFVQSSDNNYVKFFCTADEFTTDVTKWQGVDDEPIAGSDNMVKSGGVSYLGLKHNGYINGGNWTDLNSDSRMYYIMKIPSTLVGAEGSATGNSIGATKISFLSAYNLVEGADAGVLKNYNVNANTTVTFTVPEGANYVYVFAKSGQEDRTPAKLSINGIDLLSAATDGVKVLSGQLYNISEDVNTLTTDVPIIASDVNTLKSSVTSYKISRKTSLSGLESYVTTEYRPDKEGTRIEFTFPVISLKSVFSITANSAYRFYIRFYDVNMTQLYQSSKVSSFTMTDELYQTYENLNFIGIYWLKTDNSGTNVQDIISNGVDSMTIDIFVAELTTTTQQGIFKDIFSQLKGIDSGTSILNFNPQKEVLPKIQNLKRRYIELGGSATQYPPVLSFIHTSDFHSDNTNIVRAKEFFDEYSDYIDFMLDTGDFIGGQITDGLPTAVSQVPNMLRMIGNHDTTVRIGTSPNYSWETVSQIDCYNTNLKDYIGNWGVVQPADAATYGYCYYYKDFTDSNVRLICLDGEHWGGDDESNPDTIQLTWFQGVLASAKTAGLHVIVAVHRPPFYVNRINGNTFDSIDFPSMSGVKSLNGAVDAINDFIAEENGVSGNFICWLCGHIHQDCMGLGRDTSTQNQLVISIATASVYPSGIYSEMARANGEKSQDCFNIVGIDTHTKIIKLMRVGAQYDRHMRRRNTLCWDYENNQLIYCD